jgi:hypothetical protein
MLHFPRPRPVLWLVGEVGVKRDQPHNSTVGGAPAVSATPPRWRPRLPVGIGILLAISVVLFAVFWLLDVAFFGRRAPAAEHLSAWRLLVDLDPETLQNALGSLAQVVVAVLGIAITVVSIVVQLAATRYTPRIAEMFFRDKKNLAIMGFFVVACINAVWISIVVTSGFVPRATVAMTLVVVTASLLVLVPYFAYVFAFLDPEKVIARIGHQVLDAVLGRGAARRDRDDLELRQAACVSGLEHLSDIAVNTVAQKDKIIASGAVTALREFAVKYLKEKGGLPIAWFVLGARIHGNPDFIALAPDSLRALEHKKVWVEWKVLHQFRSVFSEALDHLPEVAHMVAIETRYIAEEALRHSDREVLVLAIRYFNTFLRSALTQRDVRACYNIFHQYRLLAEHIMRTGHSRVGEGGLCLPESERARPSEARGGQGGVEEPREWKPSQYRHRAEGPDPSGVKRGSPSPASLRSATSPRYAFAARGEVVSGQGFHFSDLVLEIGRCIAYYGQTAHKADLGFVTETAAHDLAVLCERAFVHDVACHDTLLDIFLEVDKEAETHAQEQTLRGVRKAQINLATFYLSKSALPHADRICADMRDEKPERMASIRAELVAVNEREFWEVTDRGVNFDFLDPARKEKLDEFFTRASLR